MNRKVLKNGSIRLTNEPGGVVDARTGRVYSVVITTEREERFFKEAEGGEEDEN